MIDLGSVTHYARRDHGHGIVSWVYDYWNARPIEHDGVATGLELGVQLRGDWLHTGNHRGTMRVQAGEAHHIDCSETYAVRFEGRAARGTQVGFAIYPDESNEATADEGELRFVDVSPKVDRRFLEFCRAVESQPHLPSEEIRREVWSYVRRRCEPAPRDPLAIAKRELERFFDRELFIEHIADVASMHAVTFSRRFRARYGLTPAAYRVRWRMHQAGRLLWARHDLAIREVAEISGVPDLSYFYRTFQRLFGSTPAVYRARSKTGSLAGDPHVPPEPSARSGRAEIATTFCCMDDVPAGA